MNEETAISLVLSSRSHIAIAAVLGTDYAECYEKHCKNQLGRRKEL